ncbi:hypothetical protein NMY22_g10599 [Coprinellus aureogranulatus]|nr:hypothetical protein NMY22_g10599 [Coprinellus aureogranulatus]
MPPDLDYEFPTLPRRMILEAKVPGNVVELTCLNYSITKQNFIVEALDVYLTHISSAPPPPHPRPRAQPEEKNAAFLNQLPPSSLSAVASVKHGLHMALSNSPNHHAAIQRIRPHLQALLDNWIEVSLWCPYPQEGDGTADALMNPAPLSLVLMDMVALSGPDVRDEVLCAEGTIKYALGVCAIRRQSGQPFQSQSWAQGHCPGALLLLNVLEYSEDNRQKVFDVLCGQSKESKFLVGRIVENMYMRCQYISQQKRVFTEDQKENVGYDPTDHHTGPTTAFMDLQTILSIVATLCQHPALARRFMKSPSGPSFTLALEACSPTKCKLS